MSETIPERTVTHAEADAGGVRISFESVGEGPVLILCHAFGVDRMMWLAQVKSFAQSHRVITFDQRGTGRSDHPTFVAGEPDPYTVDTFADDVAAILDSLAVTQARILGLSMGAATALRFALRWPQRVERLILASAMASRLPEKIIERSKAVIEVLNRDGLEEAYRFYFGGPLFAGLQDGNTLPPMIQAAFKNASCEGFTGCYRVTIDRPAMADELHRIQSPTLILVGENDTHYIDEAEFMKRSIAGAHKVIMPGVGHAMSTENPELFNDEVLRFLGPSAAADS